MIEKVVDILEQASYAIAFTGAGISVESGVPPFRGESGIWNRYDPRLLELNYFFYTSLFFHPLLSWRNLKAEFLMSNLLRLLEIIFQRFKTNY